jgi:hypothetical protein
MVIGIDGRTEMAIKLVLGIVNGCDGCTVGFAPRVQSRLWNMVDYLDKLAVAHTTYSHITKLKKRNQLRTAEWQVQVYLTLFLEMRRTKIDSNFVNWYKLLLFTFILFSYHERK